MRIKTYEERVADRLVALGFQVRLVEACNDAEAGDGVIILEPPTVNVGVSFFDGRLTVLHEEPCGDLRGSPPVADVAALIGPLMEAGARRTS